VPFFDDFLFHRSSRPAADRTRYVDAGLTATTSRSSIMKVKRR
jgi:hypothetical protein